MVASAVVSIGEDMASRVVLLASSGARCEHRCRVALSGVTGRVRLPLSSRAGLAHRDCSPPGTAPDQSPFHLAVALAPVRRLMPGASVVPAVSAISTPLLLF